MKRAIIGLIMLGLAGVAQAALYTNTVAGSLWETATNWDTGVVPDSNTAVEIAGLNADGFRGRATVASNYTAYATTITLNRGSNGEATGGNLTIAGTGTLNATSLLGAKNSRLTVDLGGVLNLAGNISWNANKAVANNNGTINLTAGGDLDVGQNAGNSFNNSGIFSGDVLEGDGILNLTGGTMTFGGQTFFTSDGGVVNVSNDGQLIFTDQDIVSTLQGYVDTKITGITTDLIVYVGEDTIVNYHRKGTVVSVK